MTMVLVVLLVVRTVLIGSIGLVVFIIIYRYRKTGKINKQLSYNVRKPIIIQLIDLTDNDPSTLPPPTTPSVPSVPSTVQYNRITPPISTEESFESILYE